MVDEEVEETIVGVVETTAAEEEAAEDVAEKVNVAVLTKKNSKTHPFPAQLKAVRVFSNRLFFFSGIVSHTVLTVTKTSRIESGNRVAHLFSANSNEYP